jgi:hypothetical protein
MRSQRPPPWWWTWGALWTSGCSSGRWPARSWNTAHANPII